MVFVEWVLVLKAFICYGLLMEMLRHSVDFLLLRCLISSVYIIHSTNRVHSFHLADIPLLYVITFPLSIPRRSDSWLPSCPYPFFPIILVFPPSSLLNRILSHFWHYHPLCIFRFLSSILKVIIALPPSPRILNSLSLSFSSSLTSSCCQSYILTFLLASKLNLHALPTRVNLIHPLRISPRPSLVLTIPLRNKGIRNIIQNKKKLGVVDISEGGLEMERKAW